MKPDTLIFTSLVLAAAISSGVIALKQVKKTGVTSIVALALSIIFWALVYIGSGTKLFPVANEPVAILFFICRLGAVSSLFAYALSYANRLTWVSYSLILLGSILVIILAFWIGPQYTINSAGYVEELRSSLSIGWVG